MARRRAAREVCEIIFYSGFNGRDICFGPTTVAQTQRQNSRMHIHTHTHFEIQYSLPRITFDILPVSRTAPFSPLAPHFSSVRPRARRGTYTRRFSRRFNPSRRAIDFLHVTLREIYPKVKKNYLIQMNDLFPDSP